MVCMKSCKFLPLFVVTFCLAAPIGVRGAEAQSVGSGLQIGLKSLKFIPAKATAKPGQKITFVWKEKAAHNVKFPKGPASKIQSKGTYVVAFDKPGTYKYVCSIHAGMTGQITVK